MTSTKEHILQVFKGLPIQVKSNRRYYISIHRNDLIKTMNILLSELNINHLSTITGIDTGKEIEILYHFLLNGIVITIRTMCPKEDPTIDSIVSIFQGAVLYERELKDILGVIPKEHPDLALTTEEQKYLTSRIIQHQLNDQNMVYRCVGIPQIWVEVERTITDKEAVRRFIRSCCGAALRYCCIFYEGTVYPCMVLQKRAGNIRKKSFSEIWQNSRVLRKLRARDKLEGKCHHCAYRQLCGGAPR
jgi:radical SAM protein with 4Fe4S-binding SPASM domain